MVSALDSGASCPGLSPGARFSKLPVITGSAKLFWFGSFKRFENGIVKLSAKETKWTLLEV